MHRPRGAVAANNVTKSYGSSVVLDGVSLTVSPGHRIGVVGPNGVGKSTCSVCSPVWNSRMPAQSSGLGRR